jgi:hypothetical protein
MSAKHTPGLWHVAGEQGVQIRSENHQIAKVWTMRGDEWKDNARLIAAAPELLEALKDMSDEFDAMRAQLVEAGLPTNYTQVECSAIASAAIAKAEGGAA